MKTNMKLMVMGLLLLAVVGDGYSATVTGRSAKTTPAGTEEIPINDSGTDKKITISNLFVGSPALTTPTLTTPVISTGLTASGSASNNFSGSTGAFLTSTGANTFGGSAHTFASSITPATDNVGALGSNSLGWSDLFLSDGAVINFYGGNVVLTHSTGILTMGTGELRITTAGTNAASVVTIGATQTLTNKTLTSAVLGAGLTASGSTANDFSASTGAFKSSTGANVFGGSSHTFASGITAATDDGGALGSSSLGWSDLFLASGAVLNYSNGNVVLTHSSGILTLGTGELRITTAGTNAASVITVGSTSTLTNKTLTAPVINGATAASGNLDFSGSSGTFKTSTGVNTFGGSAHTFASGITPATDDGGALGSASLEWSDLFLNSGGVINFANGNTVLTHSSGILTLGTGDLRITTAGTNAASVVTVGGTQTLTNKTLTSPTMTAPVLGVATGTSVAVTGAVSSSGTAGIGYATGAGGTVTQATSKSTGVTLSKTTGQITMNNAALADMTTVSFVVTNTTVAATDVVVVNHSSAGTAGAYAVHANNLGAGSFRISVRNLSGGSLSEAIVVSFAVIKGVSN
jgi:hypothetical protein